MARGTQHRKRRPTGHAGAARTSAVATPPAAPKRKPPQWQEELFFSRLRVHAKWMFVVLALVFALGFVVFGVGSGSSGISDALQGAFHFGSTGTSISSLEKKAAAHPTDPKAWRDLATAYEQKQRTSDAVSALQRYIDLKPNDQDGLSELALQQTQLANGYGTELQNTEIDAQTLAPQGVFTPASTSPLGKVYSDPQGLADPIVGAIEANAQAQVNAVEEKLIAAESAAVTTYKRLVALDPTNATTQLSLGQAAQTANDTSTAVKAYKAFLKLAPNDPLASQVRAQLKALTAPASGTGASG